MDIEQVFDKYDDEYLHFEDIENKFSNRPDLHAFILLDKILPGTDGREMDLVSAAEHDEIFLDINCEGLARIATEEQIRDLVRCGVRYSDEYDSLAMFV